MTAISIDKIMPNPDQPRKEIDMVDLLELSQSVKDVGLINPIAVEQAGDIYILIAGERRWRACQLAGFTEIEANVMPGSNHDGSERLVRAITENIQRIDMNPIDTANAYKKLMQMGFSVQDISGMIKKHSSGIYKYLGMLEMPREIQELYRAKKLGDETGSLQVLKSIEDKKLQIRVAQIAAERGLSGLQIKSLVKRMGFQGRKRSHHKEKERPLHSYDGHWNMIAQAGLKPELLISELRDSAVATCKECNLYDDADRLSCRDCPAVVLLKYIFQAKAEAPKSPSLFEVQNG